MSRKELFVSYSSEDTRFTERLVAEIEAGGVDCWFAKRDVEAGRSYPTEIARALDECRALLLIFSDKSNRSANQNKHILREVELAAGQRKPIFPVRISDVEPDEGLAYFLRTVQWIDRATWEDRLADKIVALVREAPDPVPPTTLARLSARLRRNASMLTIGLAGAALLGAAFWVVFDRIDRVALPAGSVAPAAVETPVDIAKRGIAAAGLSLDEDGFFEAVARGSDVRDNFRAVGIDGSEAGLWRALESRRRDSEAFYNIAAFAKDARSDHYAARVATAIRDLLQSVSRSGHSKPMYDLACRGTPSPGLAGYIARELSTDCTDNTAWINHVSQFGRELAQVFRPEESIWWYMNASNMTGIPDPIDVTASQLAEIVAKKAKAKSGILRLDAPSAFFVVGNVTTWFVVFEKTSEPPKTTIMINLPSDMLKTENCRLQTRNALEHEKEAASARPACRAHVILQAMVDGSIRVLSVKVLGKPS